MDIQDLDDKDRQLIAAASAALEKNYHAERHTIGSAVLCGSGETYVAVNVESCGYGPCAEPIAIGGAISNGERVLERIVAVGRDVVDGAVRRRHSPHNIVSPCGNCRQLLLDYAPDCLVVIEHESRLVKVRARDLLPDAYKMF